MILELQIHVDIPHDLVELFRDKRGLLLCERLVLRLCARILFLFLCGICGGRLIHRRLLRRILHRRFSRIRLRRIVSVHAADGNRRQHNILNTSYGHKALLHVYGERIRRSRSVLP